MKSSKISYTDKAGGAVGISLPIGLLLYDGGQPLVIIITITVLFFLVLLTLSMLHEFIGLSIEVDRKMTMQRHKDTHDLHVRMSGNERVLTKHLVQHDA